MEKRTRFLIISLSIAVLLIPYFIGYTNALAATGYEINWWTVDGGGGVSKSSGGQYNLKGTIGQHDAGPVLEDGTYSLYGCFWVKGILDLVEYIINLPLILK